MINRGSGRKSPFFTDRGRFEEPDEELKWFNLCFKWLESYLVFPVSDEIVPFVEPIASQGSS